METLGTVEIAAGKEKPSQPLPPPGAGKAEMPILEIARGLGVVVGPSALVDTVLGFSLYQNIKTLFKKRGQRKLNPLFRLGAAVPLAYLAIAHPWLSRWGATGEEARKALPGDNMVPKAGIQYTRAITIYAPVEKVWPWLAQIGQGRGGFYSYDWLEDLAGTAIHSANEIHPEWQNLRVGDTVNLAPGLGLTVTEVEQGRSLVLQGWGAFVLEKINPQITRLITRTRISAGLVSLVYLLLLEVPHFIMERKMLLGLKQRAEGVQAVAQPDLWVSRDGLTDNTI